MSLSPVVKVAPYSKAQLKLQVQTSSSLPRQLFLLFFETDPFFLEFVLSPALSICFGIHNFTYTKLQRS